MLLDSKVAGALRELDEALKAVREARAAFRCAGSEEKERALSLLAQRSTDVDNANAKLISALGGWE